MINNFICNVVIISLIDGKGPTDLSLAKSEQTILLCCDVFHITVVTIIHRLPLTQLHNCCKSKSKVFPYSLPIVESRADSGVQAVSPQVT